jgi:hypothetical protein
MGAGAVKKHAASRSAKKRKNPRAASLAPAEGTATHKTPAQLDEDQASTPTTKEQAVPSPSSPEDHSKNTALAALPQEKDQSDQEVQATPMRTTRVTKKNLSLEAEAEAGIDEVEIIPKQRVLPERPARQRFKTMLANLTEIAEEAEFNEADRSIGGYDLHDEEWDSWKAGVANPEDEFEEPGDNESRPSKDESDSDSDSDDQSVMTSTTASRMVKPAKPPSRESRCGSVDARARTKPKPKAAGKSKATKRKYEKQLDSDSDDDSKLQRECLVVWKLGIH